MEFLDAMAFKHEHELNPFLMTLLDPAPSAARSSPFTISAGLLFKKNYTAEGALLLAVPQNLRREITAPLRMT